MSDDEINKTILEYMGKDIDPENILFRWFTNSLDSLIPVVEKLKNTHQFTLNFFMISGGHLVEIYENNFDKFSEIREQKSPSRALALACCEVIKELK